MKLALTIIHVVIAVALVVVVLMQHGKQQGLSGAIAGGAETFFGKNKGRTIDAMLKKFTAVVAILFIISSLVLTAVSVSDYNKANEEAAAQAEQTTDGETSAEAEVPEGATIATEDENGNLVDSEGNIIMTADELQAQAESQTDDTNAAPAGETPAEETPAAE